MNKKRILSIIFIFSMLFMLMPQNVRIANAVTTQMVYDYSPVLVENGSVYYVQCIKGDQDIYKLFQLEIATGNKTNLLSSDEEIVNMMVHNNILYYSSYVIEKSAYQTFSVSVDTKEKKTVCNGELVSLDDKGIYTVAKGDVSKLYRREYDSKKATLLYTGNLTFNFAKNLNNTLYFSQFNEKTSKITLYTLTSEQTKLTTLTSDKLTLDGSERLDPIVSDVVIVNGDLYYQYGVYEGSGYYWYGKLMRLASKTNKKSVIVESLYEEKIYHNDSSIFYSGGLDSIDEHYKYNTKIGKTSNYTYKIAGTESFNILGNYTYCAKADGKGLITVSRFTSGTNGKNMDKSFINISYKQNKKYEYSAIVRQQGDYLLIPVTAMDYNDTTYGWRGKCVGVTWFVADSDGKILTQFQ